MISSEDHSNVSIRKVSKNHLRRDIILDLIERGEARGVIDPSDLQEVISNPLIAQHLEMRNITEERFIQYLSKRGIEVSDRDFDKAKYKALPMVIALGNPIWETSFPNVAGQRFHFPNRYRDVVLSGRPVVYFRVGERGQMEYIGCGVIGEITSDPENVKVDPLRRPLKWFAEVRDYRSFVNPVFWKDGANRLEDLADLEWNDMVRDISAATYHRILELEHTPSNKIKGSMSRGVNPDQILELVAFNKLMAEYGIGDEEEEIDPKGKLVMADIQKVAPSAVDSSSLMMATRARPRSIPKESKAGSESAPASYRRSKYSVAIGIRAEEIVVRLLRGEAETMGYQNIRWVSSEGEKPGWDIEMVDAQGNLHSIEVKGTSGKVFPSIELTAAEWQAAEKRREKFWLFLVTECLGKHPKVQRVKDPVSLVQNGILDLSPVLWRLELSSTDGS